MPALPLLFIGLVGTGRAAENEQEGPGFRADWVMHSPGAFAYVLVVVAALSLLLRRRAPVVGLVVCGLAVSVYMASGYPFGPILLTGPAAAYGVGSRLPWRSAGAWGVGFLLVTTASAAPQFVGDGVVGWVGYVVWTGTWTAIVAAAGAIGGALQIRRRSEAGVRAEQARRAVSEERLAMARDVHDGVGHGLAVIALHAGVALHVLDRDPDRARELLLSIQATSRESLDGLRADLERLRTSGMAGDETAARRPLPGLDDLPLLLARMRDGGLVLHDEIARVPHVPAEVDAAAYRIVQESLTNVLRHAGDTPAVVRVAPEAGMLVVEVRDHGVTLADVSRTVPSGTGITGMRERAASVGGRFDAGPADGGGFVVRAELPLTRVAAPEEVSP